MDQEGLLSELACYWTTYKDIEFTSQDVKTMLRFIDIIFAKHNVEQIKIEEV